MEDIKISNENPTTSMLPSAEEMTPLELNNIKLSVNHTVLTPEYLEQLKSGTQTTPEG